MADLGTDAAATPDAADAAPVPDGPDGDAGETTDAGPVPDGATPDVAPPDAGGEEIAPGVFRIGSLAMDGPPGELALLDRIARQSPLVSVGETIHFSDGYARARTRLLRHLVERQGVRAIGFEGAWNLSPLTDGYINGGAETLQEALQGLNFGAWTNQPTIELLAWLRERNAASPGDPVRIFGFDIQNPLGDGRTLRELAAAVADETLDARVAAIDACLGARYDTYEALAADAEELAYFNLEQPLPLARHDACIQAVAELGAWLTDNAGAVEAAAGSEGAVFAAAAARSLRAFSGEIYFFSLDARAAYEARDEGMADVFDLLRPIFSADGRVAIFAHNAHNVRRSDELVAGFVFKSFGSFLAERHGEDYAPIGFFARTVEWNWPNEVGAGSFTAQSPDAIETLLAGFGEEHLFVDLAYDGPDATVVPGRAYQMGHPADTGVPLQHYRALFFMQRSEPRP